MQIQVLGSGCIKCKSLYEMTSQLVSELHLDVKVDYVTDVSKIVEMGLITSPVLAINGKPVMVGFTPDKEKIKSLLLGAV